MNLEAKSKSNQKARQPRCFTPTRGTPQPPRHFQCSFRGSIHARMGGTNLDQHEGTTGPSLQPDWSFSASPVTFTIFFFFERERGNFRTYWWREVGLRGALSPLENGDRERWPPRFGFFPIWRGRASWARNEWPLELVRLCGQAEPSLERDGGGRLLKF